MSAALAPPPASSPPPAPAARPRLLMTRAEFEAADACPGTRVEWLGATDETRDGEPLGLVWPRFGFDPDGSYAMANARHREIVANLMLAVGGRIDRDVWELATQDAEVGCPTGRIRFPDVVLIRRPAEHAPNPGRTERVITNAAVCVETLSDSTERVDHGDKPADYLSIPTVTDYLVIAQRERCVWHRRRSAADGPPAWDVTRLDAPDAAVSLADPALTIPLAEIYARVTFD